MENVEETHIEGKNLVGIIPIAGHEKYDFKTPWPHCLMPIAPDYTLIEAAVAECAWAGCIAWSTKCVQIIEQLIEVDHS